MAAIEPHVERVVGAEGMVAEVALRVCFGDGVAQHLEGEVVLAADVDPRLVPADREARDGRAFDECVRGVLHQVAVFGASGLGLVGVDDDELRPGMIFGHEGPLHRRGEVGAAAPAETGHLDLVDDLLRGHGGDDFLERRITAE